MTTPNTGMTTLTSIVTVTSDGAPSMGGVKDSASAVQIARLLQFGDSILPVGAFSFSGGIESAVQQGVVRDLASLREFVRTAIDQAASGDGIGLIAAHRAAVALDVDRLSAIDRQMMNRKLSDETRTMSERLGKKLTQLASRVAPSPLMAEWLARILERRTPGTYAACLAVLFASVGLTERDAFVAHQYGVATTVLSAALRLMKVDHNDTQALLFEINARCGDAYEHAASARLEDMCGFAPMAEILAAVHARAHVRLFMN
jgi:urease accessory protein